MNSLPRLSTAILLSLACALPTQADTVHARCDIYPAGQDQSSAVLACDFSQRQGWVSIERADGVRYELTPSGDVAGNYTDQHGKAAYRQSGLGSDGLIFRLANKSVYVYWDSAGLPSAATPTAAPTPSPASH